MKSTKTNWRAAYYKSLGVSRIKDAQVERHLKNILEQDIIDWAKLCELCVRMGTEGSGRAYRSQAWMVGLGLLPTCRAAWRDALTDLAEEYRVLKQTCSLLIDWEGEIGDPPLSLEEIFITSQEKVYLSVPPNSLEPARVFLKDMSETFLEVIVSGEAEAYFCFSAYVLLLLEIWGCLPSNQELTPIKLSHVEKTLFKLALHFRGLGGKIQNLPVYPR
mmetsp:Transcript_28555/g.37379  ORF Transcript_28555/g.37379 Transcript_28555/m.37379 type:complete len:218 (+) Transcript_28555:279-932(+)